MTYLFVFGRTPKLAFLELHHLLASATLVAHQVALGETSEDPGALMNLLGGTVKIARVLGQKRTWEASDFVPYLIPEQGNRVVFGLSTYGADIRVGALPGDIKEELASRGISARYITPKHGEELTSVVITKQGVEELVLVGGSETIAAKTVAVQPFEAWNERDYGRPYSDAAAGMLPPKVARMIVNIARAPLARSHLARQGETLLNPTLLDPFCGMGTIVAEALLTGWNGIGSDVNGEIVAKAIKNIAWVSEKFPAQGTARFFTSDATHVSGVLGGEKVDAIVTEPFMGSTTIATKAASGRVNMEAVQNTLKGLEKLYIGCLREWHMCLVPAGLVVMAIPSYTLGGRTLFVKKVIDRCESLGYTITAGPIEYGRPQAVVRRNFYVFRKKK